MNFEDCYVRPIAWRGSQQMGISTAKSDINVAIAVWNDWASYFKIEDQSWPTINNFTMETAIT